jgi:N2-citryl-N6-acetyl-N6-hydroxylysine synthase
MDLINQHNQLFAEFNSLQSFLNSYLIGCQDYKIVLTSQIEQSAPTQILKESHVLIIYSTIYIPLLRKSHTGFHLFSHQLFINDHSLFSTLSFKNFVDKICQIENADSEHSALFQQRVEQSQNTIKHLLYSQKNKLSHARSFEDLSFKNTEQTLIFGHFAHPYPKLQEYKSQGPDMPSELEESLNLQWCLVKKSILQSEHSYFYQSSDVAGILKSTYLSEIQSSAILDDINEDYALFPFHPFQYQMLKNDEHIEKYLNDKKIIPLDSDSILSSWIPTTSLRTIYNEKSEWMLKFSLNIRLTNSVRILQDNEVKRGIQIHEVFESTAGKAMLEEKEINPFSMIHEPLFLAIKDEDNNILKNTIVIFRQNPFYKTDNNDSICLAALTQLGSDNITPLVCKIISKISKQAEETYETSAHKWFEAFLDTAVIPLVLLQARHGIYLGAHQQNLIIKLNANNFPEKSFYRDCQGSGYSALGFEKFKTHSPSLNNPNGNVLPVDFANSLMGYYLFINSTLYTIKTIASGDIELEKLFFKTFANKLLSLTHLNDHSFIDYILKSESILIKDNFECCLKNINENTIDNPLKIYKKMINPFFQGEE